MSRVVNREHPHYDEFSTSVQEIAREEFAQHYREDVNFAGCPLRSPTELCTRFAKDGTCRYQSHCTFSHHPYHVYGKEKSAKKLWKHAHQQLWALGYAKPSSEVFHTVLEDLRSSTQSQTSLPHHGEHALVRGCLFRMEEQIGNLRKEKQKNEMDEVVRDMHAKEQEIKRGQKKENDLKQLELFLFFNFGMEKLTSILEKSSLDQQENAFEQVANAANVRDIKWKIVHDGLNFLWPRVCKDINAMKKNQSGWFQLAGTCAKNFNIDVDQKTLTDNLKKIARKGCHRSVRFDDVTTHIVMAMIPGVRLNIAQSFLEGPDVTPATRTKKEKTVEKLQASLDAALTDVKANAEPIGSVIDHWRNIDELDIRTSSVAAANSTADGRGPDLGAALHQSALDNPVNVNHCDDNASAAGPDADSGEESPPITVRDMLGDCNIPSKKIDEYLDFIKDNLYDVDDAKGFIENEFTDEDLQSCGISISGHRRRILSWRPRTAQSRSKGRPQLSSMVGEAWHALSTPAARVREDVEHGVTATNHPDHLFTRQNTVHPVSYASRSVWNMRLQNVLHFVAMPIVLRLFSAELDHKDEKEQVKFMCLKCNADAVAKWKPCCILQAFRDSVTVHHDIINSILWFDETATGEELLYSRMDIDNIDKLYQCLSENRHLSDTYPGVLSIVRARNKSAHIRILTQSEFEHHLTEVYESCTSLFNELLNGKSAVCPPLVQNLASTEDVQRLWDQCTASWAPLDIEDEALRYYRRSAAMHSAHTIDFEGLAAGFKIKRTNELVDVLRDDTRAKILLIPPITRDGQSDVRKRYACLARVKWISVIDFADDVPFAQPGDSTLQWQCAASAVFHGGSVDQKSMFNYLTSFRNPVDVFVLANQSTLSTTESDLEAKFKMFHTLVTQLRLPFDIILIVENIAVFYSGILKDNYQQLAGLNANSDTVTVMHQHECDFALLNIYLLEQDSPARIILPAVSPHRRVLLPRTLWVNSGSVNAELLDLSTVEGDKNSCDKHLESYLAGGRAHWSLFQDGKIILREQVQVIFNMFMEYPDIHVAVEHAPFQGGTTVCRHVLFNLRHHFVCIALSGQLTHSGVESLGVKMRKLKEHTGLPVLLLVDVDHAPVEETTEDIHHLLRLGNCQVLYCRHSARSAVAIDKQMEVVRLMQLSSREQLEIQKLLLGSRKSIRFEHDHEVICLDDYVSSDDCLVNTARILDEICERPGSWQSKLVSEAVYNPSALVQIGFWGLEIHELANGHTRKSKTVTARVHGAAMGEARVSLLHCGLLFEGSRYEERAKQAVHDIVQEMNDSDILLLRLVVFAALFAPGHGVDVSVVPTATPPSTAIQALVSCSNQPTSGNAMHLAIYAQPLVSLLAREKRVFDSAAHGKTSITKLIGFAEKELVVILSDSDTRTEQIRRMLLLPLLNCAFCDFRVWHSDIFGSSPASTHHSFLVEVLKNGCFRYPRWKRVADVFVKIAQLFQAESVVRSLEKDFLETLISLATYGCRVLHDLAYEQRERGEPSQTWEQTYLAAWTLLRGLPDSAKDHKRYHDSVGILYRRQLQANVCVFEQRYDHADRAELQIIIEFYLKGIAAFTEAARKSDYAWANPLVGAAQLWIEFWEYMRSRLRFNPTCDSRCRGGCCRRHAEDLIRESQSLQNTFDCVDLHACAEFLHDARLACKYVKISVSQLRTKSLVKRLCTKLYQLCQSIGEMPPNILAQCQEDSISQSSVKELLDRLAAAAESLSSRLTRNGGMKSPHGKWADLEGILEFSTAIAARVAAGRLSGGLAVTATRSMNELTILRDCDNKLLVALQHMRDDVDAGRAHGLGAHVACVLNSLYNVVFRRQGDTTQLEDALSLLGAASKTYSFVHTTRYFISDSPSIPEQPLSAFVSVDRCGDMRKTLQSGHDKFAEYAMRIGLHRFTGEVMLGKNRLPSVKAQRLPPIRFTVPQYFQLGAATRTTFDEGDNVEFFVGVKETSLWAHGVRKVEP
eukprot:m.390134 g.390134  ORF g.390134 m.390134 type:complete len:1983 (-) comp21055_c4_seq31:846-6794(-)